MPVDVRVTGANQLADLAKQLKAIGNNDLRKELLAGIRKAAKPMAQSAKDRAERELPKAGGLNEVVAKSKFSTRTRTAGRTPGVRVVASNPHDIKALDRGRLRHPVYGNRNAWVTQKVTPGWFTDAMLDNADEVRREILAALDRVARKL